MPLPPTERAFVLDAFWPCPSTSLRMVVGRGRPEGSPDSQTESSSASFVLLSE